MFSWVKHRCLCQRHWYSKNYSLLHFDFSLWALGYPPKPIFVLIPVPSPMRFLAIFHYYVFCQYWTHLGSAIFGANIQAVDSVARACCSPLPSRSQKSSVLIFSSLAIWLRLDHLDRFPLEFLQFSRPPLPGLLSRRAFHPFASHTPNEVPWDALALTVASGSSHLQWGNCWLILGSVSTVTPRS